MRIVLVAAVIINSLDLVATTLGIHWFGNREGNPLLAGLVAHHWLAFVAIKGLAIPLLIGQLNQYRRSEPLLASAGLGLVTIALTCAVGRWVGWIAGVVAVSGIPRL